MLQLTYAHDVINLIHVFGTTRFINAAGAFDRAVYRSVYDDGFLRRAGSKTLSFVFEQKPTLWLSFMAHSRP